MTLTVPKNMLPSSQLLGGGGYMGGTVIWQESAKRYYVKIYWRGKAYRIWKYNDLPILHEKIGQKLLNKIRAEIDDGVFVVNAYMPDSPLSLSAYSEQWLKSLSVAPETLKFYRKAIGHAIDHFGGNQDIRKFTYSKLQICYNELQLTLKGKYHVLNTLKTMLKFAYNDEQIKKVPPFPKLPQGQKQEIKYLTYEQQQEVIRYIPDCDKAIFEFAMEYGLRIGEAIGLQKDCVTSKEIIIKRAMSIEGGLRQTTKTGKLRIFGITERAREILDNLPPCPSPFVFNQPNGKPYTWKVLTLRWRSACKAAGLNINLYNAIRHSLGCQLMDDGVEMGMVQDILGHTTPAMTRQYAQRSKAIVTNVLQFRGKKVSDHPVTGISISK